LTKEEKIPLLLDNKDKIKFSMIFLVGYLATTGLIFASGVIFFLFALQ